MMVNKIYSSSLSIANFTGKTLNFNKIGRVLLSARFEGSDYYQDAVIQVVFDILKDNQAIIPSELPNQTPLKRFYIYTQYLHHQLQVHQFILSCSQVPQLHLQVH